MINHRVPLRPIRHQARPAAQSQPFSPPDHALLALADQLTAAVFDTRSPAWEDRGYLKITPGAVSEVTISISGHVTWEYRPARPSHLEPVRIAAIITGLLDPGTQPAPAIEPRSHRTLITTTGRALARHGLDVTIDVLDISQALVQCGRDPEKNLLRPNVVRIMLARPLRTTRSEGQWGRWCPTSRH